MGSLLSRAVLHIGVGTALILLGPVSANAQLAPRAQAPSNADKQAAKKLVDAGIAAQNAKDYDGAIELYQKAFALVPHPTLLFNVGQAHRLAGRPGEAIPFYERYLALDPTGPESSTAREILAGFHLDLALAQLKRGQEIDARENLEHALQHGEESLGAEQFKEAQKQLREVERQLGRIRVSCQLVGAEVMLDGVALFTGPGSYHGWVKAKDHDLTAKKQGYRSEARRVTVSSGELQDIELRLPTLSKATNTSRRWAAWKCAALASRCSLRLWQLP